MAKLVVALFVITVAAALVRVEAELSGSDLRVIEKHILDTLFNGYDARIRPNGQGSSNDPVRVEANAYIRSIDSIDFKTDTVSVQVTFRQQWHDPRLAFSSMSTKLPYINIVTPSSLWTPDTFFSNTKSGHFHFLLTPNVLIRIFPDGRVMYSRRLTANVKLSANLNDFPFDSQTITLKMATYGYTTDDLIYTWKETNPLEVTENLNVPSYSMVNYETGYCTARTNTGEYSCMTASIVLKRSSGQELIRVFIPSMNMVILGFLSFFIDHKATTARLLYTLVVLVALFTNIAIYNMNSPESGATRAVDIWTGTSLTFVFAALVEFIVMSYLVRRREHAKKVDALLSDVESSPTANGVVSAMTLEKPTEKQQMIYEHLRSVPTRPENLDLIARWVYPALFLAFMLIFMVSYAL